MMFLRALLKGILSVLFGYVYISFVFKDLNSGSRGSEHLEEGSRNKNDTCSHTKMEPTLISRKRKKRLRSNLPDSHNSTSLYKSAEQTVSRGI